MAPWIETSDPPHDEQLWSAYAAHAPAGLCTLRCETTGSFHAEAVSPAMAALIGASPDAPPSDVFSTQRFADPEEGNRLTTLLRETGHLHDHPARLRRDDGSTVWVEVTAAGDVDLNGTMHVWAIVRDVSDRRRREEQSRGVHQQIAQDEKMAALGQTMSGVAHELNNPLGAILAIAERLRAVTTGTPLGPQLHTLHVEAERAARIARQLLTFARKRQTTRLMVGLNTVVRESLDLRARDLTDAGVLVEVSLEDDLPEVFADPHQLQQVLINLLINAEQAMAAGGGGTLTVTTAATSPDEVAIVVRDTGPGMDEAVRARIFDPFFTTKEVGHGTGLGLAVVTAIVAEHGGAIEVASAPGAGAEFRVLLPAAGLPATSARTAPPDPQGDPQFGRGLRILLADDEPALAGAMAETLRDAGFEVTVARDGQEALALAHAQTFDAVICDLRMPRVDGPSFYRAVEAVSPPQARRVIFVTGDVTGSDTARFLDETGCRWLAKPFRLAELLRAVREMVG
jgi:PAS domain S-box-containing protein